MDEEALREQRASQRAARMTIRKTVLGAAEAPETDRLGGEARVALVWELTLAAWTLGGKGLPNYRREDVPCRFVRWSEHL